MRLHFQGSNFFKAQGLKCIMGV